MKNEITQAAEELGRDKGHAAATWATDGYTSESTYRRLLQGIEDGDPEIMDMMPAPLSGEWAGDSISELIEQSLLDRYDVVGDDRDAWCDAYEMAFQQAYWNELERTCRYYLDRPAV